MGIAALLWVAAQGASEPLVHAFGVASRVAGSESCSEDGFLCVRAQAARALAGNTSAAHWSFTRAYAGAGDVEERAELLALEGLAHAFEGAHAAAAAAYGSLSAALAVRPAAVRVAALRAWLGTCACPVLDSVLGDKRAFALHMQRPRGERAAGGGAWRTLFPPTYGTAAALAARLSFRAGGDAASASVRLLLKDPARSRGEGIELLELAQQQEQQEQQRQRQLRERALGRLREGWLAQEYVTPALLNSFKFDLRLFVLVKQGAGAPLEAARGAGAPFGPPQVLLFREGVVRFASRPYAHSLARGEAARMAHVTNVGAQRSAMDAGRWRAQCASPAGGQPRSVRRVRGLLRALLSQQRRLQRRAPLGLAAATAAVDRVWDRIRGAVRTAFADVDVRATFDAAGGDDDGGAFFDLARAVPGMRRAGCGDASTAPRHCDARAHCTALYGVDVLLSEDAPDAPLRADAAPSAAEVSLQVGVKVLEVQVSPSMSAACPEDEQLKGGLASAVFHELAGAPYSAGEHARFEQLLGPASIPSVRAPTPSRSGDVVVLPVLLRGVGGERQLTLRVDTASAADEGIARFCAEHAAALLQAVGAAALGTGGEGCVEVLAGIVADHVRKRNMNGS